MLKTKIIQVYAFNSLRNFSYIIHNQKKDIVICVDPYSSEQIINILKENDLNLTHIINTHEHWDHIKGNQDLINEYAPFVCAHEKAINSIIGLDTVLGENDEIALESDEVIHVLDTPGHTMSHICLVLKKQNHPYCIFSGDTLFQAGVGNCKSSGNLESLYQTISKLYSLLPDDTIIYPGHHYMKHNLSFTLSIDKSNENAKELLNYILKYQNSDKFFQTDIKKEKSINLFLKCVEFPQEISSALNQTIKESKDIFFDLRRLRDNF